MSLCRSGNGATQGHKHVWDGFQLAMVTDGARAIARTPQKLSWFMLCLPDSAALDLSEIWPRSWAVLMCGEMEGPCLLPRPGGLGITHVRSPYTAPKSRAAPSLSTWDPFLGNRKIGFQVQALYGTNPGLLPGTTYGPLSIAIRGLLNCPPKRKPLTQQNK